MHVNAELQVLDKWDWPVSITDLTTQTSLIGQETGLTDEYAEIIDSATEVDQIVKVKVGDWRIPFVTYLSDPSHDVDRNIWCLAFKIVKAEVGDWTIHIVTYLRAYIWSRGHFAC